LFTQADTGVIEDGISDMLLEMCQQSISNESINLLNNCSATEATALSTMYGIAINDNRNECSENGLSFFCNSIAFLCGISSFSYNSTLSLSEECVQIRDNFCAAEWRIVKNIFNLSLPDCNSFNDDSTATSDIPRLLCPDKFGEFCSSVCLPVCHEPLIGNIESIFKIMIIVLYIISLTGGVITLIASVVKRKTM